MSHSKTIGCTFMIAGTALGAGMLALPLVTAGSGFLVAAFALCFLWAMMCYTALLILEVNIHFPIGTSFGTMAEDTLGLWGKWTAFTAMILLFYALIAAYISGGANLFSEVSKYYLHLNVSSNLAAFIFTGFFGAIIYWETRVVDYVNRFLFTLKMAVLIITISIMLTHVEQHTVFNVAHKPIFILAAIPIIFTSFGFHGTIPSILKYLGLHATQLRFVFIIGSAIPLLIYLFWVLVTVGVLPLHGPISYHRIAAQHGSVGLFTIEISRWLNNHYITFAMNLFSNIAVTTSFLGVGLGLFDYFCDNLKKAPTRRREFSALLTFLPPLFFALLYPEGFIFALGFAAICLAVLAVLLPACMAWSWRGRNKQPSQIIQYRVPGGRIMLFLTFVFGLGIILLQLLNMLDALPHL